MSRLSGDLVRHGLGTRTIGQNVVYAEQTGSTNIELKNLARLGAPEGVLYVTDEQLAGRGRMKRSWYAPAGSSLLLSLLFRPGDFIVPAQTQYLTMICGLAIADAIETHTGLTPGLKWPNDLIWKDNKKLAGILTESEFTGDQLSWVIVGLGLNVNVDFRHQAETNPDSGSPPLVETATSLSMILGQDTASMRLPILQRFLVNTEQRYDALRQGQSPRDEWAQRLVGIGKNVTATILDGAHQYEGTIIGVDENGALRLEQADGSMVTILAGDVTLR